MVRVGNDLRVVEGQSSFAAAAAHARVQILLALVF